MAAASELIIYRLPDSVVNAGQDRAAFTQRVVSGDTIDLVYIALYEGDILPSGSPNSSYANTELPGPMLIARTSIAYNETPTNNRWRAQPSSGGASYSDEQAQDAVGGILVDSASINFTYNDAGGSITAVVIPTLIVQEGGSDRDTAVGTINFDGSDFNVTSSPAGQANVSLGYALAAGQPAEGDHDHGHQSHRYVLKNAGAATVSTVGMAAPTLTATASNTDAADGMWLNHASGAVSGNSSGVVSAFTQTRRDWSPRIHFTVKTPSDVSSIRLWVGVFSNTVDASATPSVHMAAFRYDTAADGTAFWRTVTNNGGAASHAVNATSVVVAIDTVYRFEIRLLASSVEFYINGSLVRTESSSLPAATQLLGYGVRVTTLTAAARSIKWGRIAIVQPY